jgi:hypothetical protein
MEVVVTAVVAFIMLRRIGQETKQGMAGFDFVGVLLSGSGMSSIVMGILLASTYGFFRARSDVMVAGRTMIEEGGISPTLILVAVGLVILVGFILWERRLVQSGKDPLVRPEVLQLRIPRLGSIALAFQYMFSGGILFIVPVFLQTALGYDALQSGIALLPTTVALVIGALISSRLVASGRVSRELLIIASYVLMAFGALLVALTFDADSLGRDFVIPLAVVGLGIGAGVVLQDLVQSSVPPDRASDVAGISRSSAYLGQAIGIALAGAVMVAVLVGTFSETIQTRLGLTNEQMQQVDEIYAGAVEVTAVSDDQLASALTAAGVPATTVEQVVQINALAREAALTAAVLVLAAGATLGFFVSLGLRRPSADSAPIA